MVVTDLERRVVVWNDSAERLFGITRDEAVGNPIESLYDSVIMGEGSSWVVARAHAFEHGSWRGRVVDRPRLGTRLGDELIIETDLSRFDGPDGRAVGIISVKRDVTATVRIERELAALSSLATATGRDPHAGGVRRAGPGRPHRDDRGPARRHRRRPRRRQPRSWPATTSRTSCWP